LELKRTYTNIFMWTQNSKAKEEWIQQVLVY
jgi:hypothetical protein